MKKTTLIKMSKYNASLSSGQKLMKNGVVRTLGAVIVHKSGEVVVYASLIAAHADYMKLYK